MTDPNNPPLLQFAIPKGRMEDGVYYAGKCRNANIAKWCAGKNCFYHWRTKFAATFVEAIDYWEVDGQFDGFIPVFRIGEQLPDPIPNL